MSKAAPNPAPRRPVVMLSDDELDEIAAGKRQTLHIGLHELSSMDFVETGGILELVSGSTPGRSMPVSVHSAWVHEGRATVRIGRP